MEFKELKKKSESELQILLGETRDNLRTLRFKDASKQLKNVREIRETKKSIARILMLIKSKQSDKTKDTKQDEEAKS